MNLGVSIIDQQVRGLAQRCAGELAEALGRADGDETTLHSAAFVALCAKVMLDIEEAEAIGALTEGANDFGVDAMLIGAVTDGEFTVTLIQGKYSHANLEGKKAFPQGGVEKAVQAVATLFNPLVAVTLNRRLEVQVEEVRSLIVDGNIPRVRFLLCNNGERWSAESAEVIERAGFGERAVFEHVNHDVLVGVLQTTAPVNDAISFSGRAVVEDFNYARVFVGKVKVSELARLMSAHGDRLLERNIRRYLGLHGNRVNEQIAATLRNAEEREKFYFYNNGVTLICDRFEYNGLQHEDYRVRVWGLKIINGGQTSKTVETVLSRLHEQVPFDGENLETTYVLVRLYQIASDENQLVQMITYATNSQNPVDLRDLRSNDEVQKRLETSVGELGYTYRRQRAVTGGAATTRDITAGTAAEAVLAVWREHPQQAKFRSAEHFGKLYDEIFSSGLNGAQVVVAVLLFRIAENRRKRPPPGSPAFVVYASWFAAMLMGRYLLADLGVGLAGLDHRTFERAEALVQAQGEAYFQRSIDELSRAIEQLYGGQHVTLQRLAATFRRGDLLSILQTAPSA